MSRLTDLLRQARKADAQLGADLEAEFRALASRRTFGLVFERHQPEEVELPQRPVRKGDKVHVLPPRGASDEAADRRLWSVAGFEVVEGSRSAKLVEQGVNDPETRLESTGNLVVVAEFRDPIYPGLVETGRVERGGDKPFHSVINAENYHALELMTYTHKGKVDCIYIDPPYNTGAKDWKYNNHYVEGDDAYRHSKWLAFMERRLKIARELLNPDDSVLIVTIDEKEYLRLGLLLEQTYPEARIQMVSSVINPKGATRSTSFGRTDEYVYFVMFGVAGPSSLPLGNEWKVVVDARAETLRWAELLRSGTNARRVDRPRLFYPVFVRNGQDGAVFDSFGDSIEGSDRSAVIPPDECVAVWPIRSDGSEGNWQISGAALTALFEKGYARFGPWRDERTTITYLKRGEQRKVEDGVFPVVGRRSDGSIVIDSSSYTPVFVPGTQWRIPHHEAGGPGGSGLLRTLMPDRRFPFPKALYAVEDALRFFVKDKPEAVVLDFFSGSGTTAHAVMRLNRQDGGSRQCISVTNNEVAADQQATLRAQGSRPGDAEWEQWGICEYITKPRIESAITGRKPDGEPVEGNYRFIDEFPIANGFDENVVFFTQTYEGPLPVAHHRAFDRVAPILWLRAGARGEIISSVGDKGWAIAENYGLLVDLDASSGFLRALAGSKTLNIVYIITDDDLAFQMVCRELPSRVTPVQLYESYLQNFELNSGRLG